jgi:xanthine dehydrogenase accessory factor
VKCATLAWQALGPPGQGVEPSRRRNGPGGRARTCERKWVGVDRRESERLLEVIRQARTAREPAALATVVRVKGSAYRREGTRMFVRQDGTYECSLSGGCLEPTVAEAASRVIATGEPVIVSYDLADDSVWGLGIGCSGAVDIRIERLEDDAITSGWLTILERGDAAVLVTPLSGVSGRMIVGGAGVIAGGLSDAGIEREAVASARERLRAPYPASGPESIGGAELFYEITMPPPDLVIFGAGHDAAPVAQVAWMLGFSVTVVDGRQAFLAPARFPGATLVCAHFSQFADRVKAAAGAFMLVMNHHVERDRESLRFSLESDAAYIGVLGPRSRYEKLLAGLAAQGYAPDASTTARVHSPVGLSLGAETPHEVAVSILGEILAIRRGFEGGFLSGSVRSLHRPDDRRRLASS